MMIENYKKITKDITKKKKLSPTEQLTKYNTYISDNPCLKPKSYEDAIKLTNKIPQVTQKGILKAWEEIAPIKSFIKNHQDLSQKRFLSASQLQQTQKYWDFYEENNEGQQIEVTYLKSSDLEQHISLLIDKKNPDSEKIINKYSAKNKNFFPFIKDFKKCIIDTIIPKLNTFNGSSGKILFCVDEITKKFYYSQVSGSTESRFLKNLKLIINQEIIECEIQNFLTNIKIYIGVQYPSEIEPYIEFKWTKVTYQFNERWKKPEQKKFHSEEKIKMIKNISLKLWATKNEIK